MADNCEYDDEHSGCIKGCESFDPLSPTDSAEWRSLRLTKVISLRCTSCSVSGMRTVKPVRALSWATADKVPVAVCQRFKNAQHRACKMTA